MAINIFPRVDVSGINRWAPLRVGHWSTQGLIFCYPLGQGSPVSMAPVTRVGAHLGSTQANPRGITFAVGAYATVMSNAQRVLPTQRVTVLVIRQNADTTLRQNCLFGFTAIGGASERLGVHCPWTDGNLYWDFGGATSPNRLAIAFTKTTRVESLAFVAGARGSTVYRDGRAIGSQSTAITRPAGTGDFRLNSGAGASSADPQDVHFFALLDAEWTAAQVAAWHSNPWLMFESGGWPATTASAAITGRPTLYYAMQRGR